MLSIARESGHLRDNRVSSTTRSSSSCLKEVKTLDPTIKTKSFNVNDYDMLKSFLKPADIVLLAVPGYMGYKLLEIIKQHARETNSELAKRLINDWSMEIRKFWQVVPLEILSTLKNPVSSETVVGKIA